VSAAAPPRDPLVAASGLLDRLTRAGVGITFVAGQALLYPPAKVHARMLTAVRAHRDALLRALAVTGGST
jgi:hypothetical protein